MRAPLDPAIKKSYEVSYALFRVAAALASRNFAEMLEKEALNLLRSVVGGIQADSQASLGIIRYLVTLGKDTGNIHPANVDLLIQQIDSLDSMLLDRAKIGVTSADIANIFSPLEPAIAESANKQHRVSTKPANNPAIQMSDRQGAILERIRQSGNCRTRDLQAMLPDLSERTLRYDLQRLIEDGRIERGGGGGPASWYRIKGDSPGE